MKINFPLTTNLSPTTVALWLGVSCFIFFIAGIRTFFLISCICLGRSSPIEIREFFSL